MFKFNKTGSATFNDYENKGVEFYYIFYKIKSGGKIFTNYLIFYYSTKIDAYMLDDKKQTIANGYRLYEPEDYFGSIEEALNKALEVKIISQKKYNELLKILKIF